MNLTETFLPWFAKNWIMASLGTVAVLIVLFLIIGNWKGILRFWNEVQTELSKCSWPWDPLEKGFRRYKELIDSTTLVIVSMLLLGGYTSLFDLILLKFTGLVMTFQF